MLLPWIPGPWGAIRRCTFRRPWHRCSIPLGGGQGACTWNNTQHFLQFVGSGARGIGQGTRKIIRGQEVKPDFLDFERRLQQAGRGRELLKSKKKKEVRGVGEQPLSHIRAVTDGGWRVTEPMGVGK